MKYAAIAGLVLLTASAARADEVALYLGGKEISLDALTRIKISALSREIMARCGPNTAQHPDNFGPLAARAAERWKSAEAGSHLRVRYTEGFESRSHLGGELPVSEALIGLEGKDLFVGPDFTRNAGVVAEHLQCGYLPSLELACMPELAPHLSARYWQTCASLERGRDGRIVLPPPDVAPSCS